MPSSRIVAWCAGLLLCGCASESDRFYALRVLPEGPPAAASTPTLHVLLKVTVPARVDRSEMIIDTSGTGIRILDHQRWVEPLSDQVAQTLSRDLERRRADVLIGDRGFDQATVQPIVMTVDIVRMSARLGGRVDLDVHWRIVDAGVGTDRISTESFDAPLGTDYSAVAEAYSEVLSALADKLANGIRPR